MSGTPPPDGDIYGEALAAITAGNPPADWDAVLHELWFVQPNDEIGGWCVMNRNYPPSQLNRSADPSARVVAEVGTQTVATYIVVLHNVSLRLHDQFDTERDEDLSRSSGTTQLPAGSSGPDLGAGTTTSADSGDCS